MSENASPRTMTKIYHVPWGCRFDVVNLLFGLPWRGDQWVPEDPSLICDQVTIKESVRDGPALFAVMEVRFTNQVRLQK